MLKEKNNASSFARNSLYIFAAKFFPTLAIFVGYLYFSHELSAADYGQYQNFWIQLFFLSAIATVGFPVFILTYSPANALWILRKIVAKQYLVYTLFVALLALLFGYIQLMFNYNLLLTTIPFFMLYVGVVLADSLLIVFKSFRSLISINIGFAILFLALHFWKVQSQITFIIFLLPLTFLLLLRLVFCVFAIKNAIAKSKLLQTTLEENNWTQIRQLWLQLGIYDLIQVLFRWVDKFILSFVLVKSLFAVYTNATIEIAFLPLIFSAVSSAAVQHWAGQHAEKKELSQIQILHYSARILSAIIFPIFFFLLFFRNEFLITIFSERYISGVWIFVVAQLVLPLRAYPFTALLQSLHRGDIINKGAIIDFVLAMLLMYPLYLLFGLVGVALSFVLSTYWQAAYYLVQTAKLTQKPISVLVPIKMLLQKFLFFAVLFALFYFAVSILFSDSKTIFGLGIFLLSISVFVSLYREWRNNKNTIL